MSHNCPPNPPTPCHHCLCLWRQGSAFEFQSALGTLLCLFVGGWVRWGASRSGWLRVNQICGVTNGQPTGGQLVRSQGAQGFNCCPRGEPCPSFFTRRPPSPHHRPCDENTGSTINNRLTLLPFPPPPPVSRSLLSIYQHCLMLASSFSVNPLTPPSA